MKIAIPTNDKTDAAKVCVSFGRAPYFGIFDTENNLLDFIDNMAAESSGGAGIKAAQQLVDAGVSVLLTPRCGENAADVLGASKIKIYKSENITAEENIKKYINNELKLLCEIHPGIHGNGEK
jgi:predicted Fe-Mo cluster-binding NifX family protein